MAPKKKNVISRPAPKPLVPKGVARLLGDFEEEDKKASASPPPIKDDRKPIFPKSQQPQQGRYPDGTTQPRSEDSSPVKTDKTEGTGEKNIEQAQEQKQEPEPAITTESTEKTSSPKQKDKKSEQRVTFALRYRESYMDRLEKLYLKMRSKDRKTRKADLVEEALDLLFEKHNIK